MPRRQIYVDQLQLRADLWRIPFLLCIATLLLFVATGQVDRAAARGAREPGRESQWRGAPEDRVFDVA